MTHFKHYSTVHYSNSNSITPPFYTVYNIQTSKYCVQLLHVSMDGFYFSFSVLSKISDKKKIQKLHTKIQITLSILQFIFHFFVFGFERMKMYLMCFGFFFIFCYSSSVLFLFTKET